MREALWILVSLLGLAASACSASSRACNVGADCASGACNLDGTCAVLADAGPLRDAGEAAADVRDAGRPEAPPPPDGSCVADDSGTLLRSQVVLQAGLHATFRIATDATVSTAGETEADGGRVWDLSGAISGDQDVLVDTVPTTGAWYASAFAGSTYATALSSTSTLLGVFQTTSSALLLQGVASPEGGLTQTELTYTPPVTTLQFPLTLGTSWSTESTVTGQAEGVESVYTEDYQSTADARGTLKTPLATFSVQRVGTVLTRTVGLAITITRTYVFLTDCYGAVAQITSLPDEPNAEFSTAAEVRRIAP